LGWATRQGAGNAAVITLSDAMVALATAQSSNAAAMQNVKNLINKGLGEWEMRFL
jgi:hypothetical protein